MNARNHHYLPQFYLKGFTEKDSKESKLHVYDFRKNEYFPTIPRNVGADRDFNRVDNNGSDYNIIESLFSIFESKAASILDNFKTSYCLDENNKIYILFLIALLSVRSPQRRKTLKKYEKDLTITIAKAITGTKEIYNACIDALKNDKKVNIPSISYEDFKSYIHKDKSFLNIPNELLIKMEMDSIESILPYLHARNWSILKTTLDSGPFITSDKPIHIFWNNVSQTLTPRRFSPGFGSQESYIYFPLSKSIALIGDFYTAEGLYEGTKQLVSAFNSRVIIYAFNQIYTPQLEYNFIGQNGNILTGNKLIDQLHVIRPPKR
jgi:hypothetical protein